MKFVAACAVFVLAAAQTGCFAMQKDHDAVATQAVTAEKQAAQARAEVTALRADLEATRQRLDNALRANADSSSDLQTSKARTNELAGKVDEASHNLDELKRDVASSKSELAAKLEELKKAQAAAPNASGPTPAPAPAPAPAPVTVPQDKAAHFKAIDESFAKKEWATLRFLAPEYLSRYPNDTRSDAVLFYAGEADLAEGRPTSALGNFNRLLKQFPKSTVLDKTLFGMGEAYMMMHDCTNAKLAYEACDKRYAKEKLGAESRSRLQLIAKNEPGTCAPQ